MCPRTEAIMAYTLMAHGRSAPIEGLESSQHVPKVPVLRRAKHQIPNPAPDSTDFLSSSDEFARPLMFKPAPNRHPMAPRPSLWQSQMEKTFCTSAYMCLNPPVTLWNPPVPIMYPKQLRRWVAGLSKHPDENTVGTSAVDYEKADHENSLMLLPNQSPHQVFIALNDLGKHNVVRRAGACVWHNTTEHRFLVVSSVTVQL